MLFIQVLQATCSNVGASASPDVKTVFVRLLRMTIATPI